MSQRNQLYLFLLFWFLLNLVTAANTQLYSDEAYYWLYSLFLDWGYFDHPPMVALTIKMGEWLGKSELGVRIINVILGTACIYLIHQFVRPRNVLLFSMTIFSFIALHVVGFVSLPDTSFLFFALLFFLAYKRFLANASPLNIILFGIASALMMYSKYHGGLIIILVISSNLKLLLNFKFYMVGALALVLFAPHVLWQIDNEFPSFKYHFSDIGGTKTYKLAHTLEYFFGNIPAMGGLVALALFIASFKIKASDVWEKGLKWNLYGTLIFFFFITFKASYIEPNWTLFCAIPIIYFGYRWIEDSKWEKSYRMLVIFSTLLLIVYRIHIFSPLMVIKKDRVWEFHQAREFVSKVDSIAQERLIVSDKYQDASLLNFYSKAEYRIPCINVNSRANQYSIWNLDSALCDRNVLFVQRNVQDGPLIGRNFRPFGLKEINQLSSPNAFEIAEINSEFTQKELSIQFKFSGSCELNVIDFYIEFDLRKDEERLGLVKVPMSKLVYNKEFYKHTFQLKEIANANLLLIKVGSEKLGGTINKFTIHSIDAHD